MKRGEIEIDELGRVWKIARKHTDKLSGMSTPRPCQRVRLDREQPDGYFAVTLRAGKKTIGVQAHRLNWLHAFGPIPDGQMVRHSNGIKGDNRISNLELISESRAGPRKSKLYAARATLPPRLD